MDMRDAGKLMQEFDGIFAQASLLHIPKKEIVRVLQTLVSKLAPGGFVYVAVKGMQSDGPEEEIKEENDYGYPYHRFFSYYSVEELARYFKDAGLTIAYQNIAPTGKSNWIQIIGKK